MLLAIFLFIVFAIIGIGCVLVSMDKDKQKLADRVVNDITLRDDEPLHDAYVKTTEAFANFRSGDYVKITLYKTHLSITNKIVGANLDYEKINSCDFGVKKIIKHTNSSSFGRTVIGGAIGGVGGAVVGALSAKDTNKKVVNKYYLTINYVDKNGQLKSLVFEDYNASAGGLENVLSKILKNLNSGDIATTQL